MTRLSSLLFPLLALGLVGVGLARFVPAAAARPSARIPQPTARVGFERLSTAGEYGVRGPGFAARVASDGLDLVTPAAGRTSRFRIRFAGARAGIHGVAGRPLPGKVHELVGKDPSRWRLGVRRFGQVAFADVYPGVDLTYHASADSRDLEYDLSVAPGSDPSRIRLELPDARRLAVNADGTLVAETSSGTVRQRCPAAFQVVGGKRRTVPCELALSDASATPPLQFRLGDYDRSRPLVIDPVIAFATYFGGSADDVAMAVAVDSSRNIYIAGRTTSLDFPVRNAGQSQFVGGGSDAFVAKWSSSGTTLIYSTYLGGFDDEFVAGLAVDALGNVYLTGATGSANFPVLHAAQPVFHGGRYDGFVTKLSSSGRPVYSTYIGGSDTDIGEGIAVDPAGRAYVTGSTQSPSFPTTRGVFQRQFGGGNTDAFVARFTVGGQLDYSTFLGGADEENPGKYKGAIAVDGTGHAYVAGTTRSGDFPIFPQSAVPIQPQIESTQDAFVVKLGTQGESLAYATFLGGRNDDGALGIAVDANGSAYVTGITSSVDFPVTPGTIQPEFGGGNIDAWVTRLTPDGQDLIFSTYLGGDGDESSFSGQEPLLAGGIALDPFGNAFITGRSGSTDFPQVRPFQLDRAGLDDAFLTKINGTGDRILYSSFFGGGANDAGLAVAVDTLGSAVVTGFTASLDLPVFHAWQRQYEGGFTDAFLLKVDEPEVNNPHLVLSADVVRFPNTRVGRSQTLSIRISNLGFHTLTGSIGTLTAPFSIVSGGGSITLPAAHAQVLTLKFAPTAVGTFNRTLTIHSNDPEHPTETLRLIGRSTS